MRQTILSLALVLLLAGPGWGAVAYDNKCNNWAIADVITTCSITIGSGANRAVAVILSISNPTITITAVTVGGNALTLVDGSDNGTGNFKRVMTYCAITTLTGAQTVQVTWEVANTVAIGAISADGVDQTTPCNNGTSTASDVDADGWHQISITSTSGDLTISGSAMGGSGTATTDKNLVYNQGALGSGDRGNGSGSNTHTWTKNVNDDIALTGVNFKQASASSAACTLMLLGVGGC